MFIYSDDEIRGLLMISPLLALASSSIMDPPNDTDDNNNTHELLITQITLITLMTLIPPPPPPPSPPPPPLHPGLDTQGFRFTLQSIIGQKYLPTDKRLHHTPTPSFSITICQCHEPGASCWQSLICFGSKPSKSASNSAAAQK